MIANEGYDRSKHLSAIGPCSSVPEFLRPLSYILSLTYSSEALRAVMLKGASTLQKLPDLMFLRGFIIVMLIADNPMLRRVVNELTFLSGSFTY